MRTVIVHYHTYKNSGSSFDEQLTQAFGEEHLLFDGPFAYNVFPQSELLKIVLRHPSVVAFSSHQIRLPVPASLNVNILPVAFVRHPLLRIRSMYSFSRRRAMDLKNEAEEGRVTPLTAHEQWASELDFGGWLDRVAADKSMPLISNAQTQIYGGIHGEQAPRLKRENKARQWRWSVSDLEQAKRNLAVVPLLARTEYYQLDVARFSGVLANYGIEFSTAEPTAVNVTSEHSHLSVDDRIAAIRDEVGQSRFDWLTAANEQDLAIFQWVTNRLNG